jgi:PilZ domain-containing protein
LWLAAGNDNIFRSYSRVLSDETHGVPSLQGMYWRQAMPNQPKKIETLGSPSLRESVQATTEERRSANRHPLVVTAEAEELTTGIKLPGRISDLSKYGCYLDTMNPFPPGTRIRIRLSKGNEIFQSLALAIYSHDALGMGISFTDVSPGAQETLQRWLAKPGGVKPAEMSSDSLLDPVLGANDGRFKAVQFERLVQILANKGLLTQEELRRIFN